MGNNANGDYSNNNRKLQDESDKGRKIVNKGFPHYDKKEDSESDNSFNDNSSDSDQEGFIDDSDFGHITPRTKPNLDETATDGGQNCEKEKVNQKNADLDEETPSNDDF